ncbi:hypothetical protein GCM10017673_54990 [Streptosporangium violaceochromogenes]|nr:hypothetical protein GCM10017673_54990 [Streptosporangium violaceochromogenes]
MTTRPHITLRAVLLVLLTFGAGATDVVGFLGLNRVFTANMTGNIVLFGLAAGRGEAVDVVVCGAATAAFAAGLLLGFRICGPGDPSLVWPLRITLALGVDLALQAVFLAGWAATGARPPEGVVIGLVVLSSTAMGVQTAAARRLAVDGITTTFVTGTLTSMMGALATGTREAAGLRAAVIAGLAAGAGAAGVLFHPAPLAAAAIGPLVVAAVIAAVVVARLHTPAHAGALAGAGRLPG